MMMPGVDVDAGAAMDQVEGPQASPVGDAAEMPDHGFDTAYVGVGARRPRCQPPAVPARMPRAAFAGGA